MEHTINRYIDFKNVEEILPQIAGEQHERFAVKLEELRQSLLSDLSECESDPGIGDASPASDWTDDSDVQRQIWHTSSSAVRTNLGMEPGCAIRNSRYGNLADLGTEDVEDHLQHRTYAVSRRTPINAVTRAKKNDVKSENEHGIQQKRKFEEVFGHEGPASKHQKLEATQGCCFRVIYMALLPLRRQIAKGTLWIF